MYVIKPNIYLLYFEGLLDNLFSCNLFVLWLKAADNFESICVMQLLMVVSAILLKLNVF